VKKLIDETQMQEENLKLLNIFSRVINANKDKKLKWHERLGRAEGLATKCFHHCSTIVYLFRDTTLPENEIHIFYFSTINVATRAALETLLAFAYVFTLPENEQESDFAFYSWVMCDLMTRQSLTPYSDEHRRILESDKVLINDYRAKIISNPFFKSLKKEKRERVLSGEWKVDGWVRIGKKVGFDNRIIEWTYSYLCSYSHSGFMSILQLQTAIVNGHKSPPMEPIIETVGIVLANMIDLYCIVFPFSHEELYKDDEAVSLVQKYLDMTGHNQPNSSIS
jgi:hypothetical protein